MCANCMLVAAYMSATCGTMHKGECKQSGLRLTLFLCVLTSTRPRLRSAPRRLTASDCQDTLEGTTGSGSRSATAHNMTHGHGTRRMRLAHAPRGYALQTEMYAIGISSGYHRSWRLREPGCPNLLIRVALLG